MASSDLLQTFLTFHLENDASSAYHLPFVLSGLSQQSIESSPSLSKWTNRVNALIHSRNSGARWAGLCMALETSIYSRGFMMGSAQAWITVVLPMLSRIETLAVWKAAIRLLCYVFASTTDLSEFQRQTATPNVPKFSSALTSLVEKQSDDELRVLCLNTLAVVVPLYPTLHRQLHALLSTVTLKLLDGSAFTTPPRILASACRLHSRLYVTGGKVGAAGLWRKSVDETIEFCAIAISALRGTASSNEQSPTDALLSVPLQLDRLRCGIELLCYLLSSSVSRPVSLPLKSLVDLSVDVLRSTVREELSSSSDPSIRLIETTATPYMLELGCRLLDFLSRCVQHKLAPHLTRILSVITYHLEQKTPVSQRLPFVRILPSILDHCLSPCDPLLSGRILKAILPSLTLLLHQKPSEEGKWSSQDAGSKKGKKRARGFDGDDVFKVGPDMLCKTPEDGIMVLAVLDALPVLLKIPNLPTYLQSISSRALLSILLSLSEQPSSVVARDVTLKNEIVKKTKILCTLLAAGTSSTLSKTFPLVIDAISSTEDQPQPPNIELLVDLMLHPRLPPLLRSLPSLDTVALSSVEESKDERETRQNLGLQTGDTDRIQTDRPQSASTFVPQNGEPVPLPVAATIVSSTAEVKNPLIPNHASSALQLPASSYPPVSLIPDANIPGDKSSPSLRPEEKTFQKTTIVNPTVDAMAVDDEDVDIEVPPLDMNSDSELEE